MDEHSFMLDLDLTIYDNQEYSDLSKDFKIQLIRVLLIEYMSYLVK